MWRVVVGEGVMSCGWWRGDPPSPLHQPQLAMWASCAHKVVQIVVSPEFSSVPIQELESVAV